MTPEEYVANLRTYQQETERDLARLLRLPPAPGMEDQYTELVAALRAQLAERAAEIALMESTT